MQYPSFFNDVEKITLQDPLSSFLGTFENGIIDFNYIDVVISAGHSCPTVAGAYLITLKALKALYKDEIPQRGSIKVLFNENALEGVAGVIAMVVTNITGATENTGFKGIGENFNRTGLMAFEQDIPGSARFIRVDTGESVDVFYNPGIIPPAAEMGHLMQKIQMKSATPDDKKQFGSLWQERVKKILIDNFDNEEVIRTQML